MTGRNGFSLGVHCRCGALLPKWAWTLPDGDECRCERCHYAYSLGYLRDRAIRRRAFHADNEIAGLNIEELTEGINSVQGVATDLVIPPFGDRRLSDAS